MAVVQPPDHPSFPPFPAQPAVEVAPDDGKASSVAALIGGALIAIGVLVPSVVTVTQYGVINHTLLEAKGYVFTDGFTLLVVATAVITAGVRLLTGTAEKPSRQRVTIALCALVAGGIAACDLNLNQKLVQDYINQFYPYATEYFGPGLYMVIAGGLIALFGAAKG